MNIKSIIFSILLLAQSIYIYAQQLQKKALLIGVSNYPPAGGWTPLNAANDLQLLKNALQHQGFVDEDICTIADEQATKENITTQIKTKLTQQVKKGDIVFFHFSGHGQQKEDKDGDEIDAYDECIVPFDSPKKYIPKVNEGQYLVTDDELRGMFYDLRKKLGSTGHLIVSLDACHSGTGTRGIATGRGTTEIMASPDYVQKNASQRNLKENNNINNLDYGSTALAPMISFFGSAQNQINYEMTDEQGLQYGSLSYALAKHLMQTKKEESYRALYEKIKIEMSSIAPLQQPGAEGNLDIAVLNGKALGVATYYKVISAAEDDRILINGGNLQGLHVNTKLGFYERDVRDIENNKPIVTGRISISNATTAVVILDSLINPEVLKESWVYVLEMSMGEIKIAVQIKINDKSLSDKISSKVFSNTFLTADPKNSKLLIEEKKNASGKNYIVLSTQDGYSLDSFPVLNYNQNAIDKMNAQIIKYLKGHVLRKMEMENEELKLSFQIIPLNKNRGINNLNELKPLKADASGLKKLVVGDTFELMIINEGIKPAYFNLIDLQPDNMHTVLLPFDDKTPEEMKILPGQKKLIPKQWIVGEPFGNEIFKLISSSKPLDLRPTYGTRGSQNKNPFEKLFSEMEQLDYYNTRGSKPVAVSDMDINIYSESFLIVK